MLSPAGASGQAGVVNVDRENFRDAPRGGILAEVRSGTPFTLGETRDQWREATLEGWIWARSVRGERSGAFDVVVTAQDGENLRDAPNGEVLGRVGAGTRLTTVEERGAWIRVRRTGWIWSPSLSVRAPAVPAAAASPDRGAQDAAPGGAEARREFTAAGRSGLVVLDRAAGDTLARVRPGGGIEVLAREGNWTRVRVEGWVVTASLGPADTTMHDVLRDVSTAFIQQQPERFRGRVVDWEAQFIALQQAERFRTDFMEGEHFMLARGPGDEPGFIYVAVPADMLAQVRSLTPLQRLRVVARIRSARSALTGAAIVDLLELRPAGG